jgi:HSP20 family molecular chaperone IbpA
VHASDSTMPDIPASLMQQLRSFGGSGARTPTKPARAPDATPKPGESRADGDGGLDSLVLPTSVPRKSDTTRRAVGSSGEPSAEGSGTSRPLISVISSEESAETAPEYELTVEEEQVRLIVELPRVRAVADLDVHIGGAIVKLRAEGVYALELVLPAGVDSDAARCKFDKKRRVLTITVPRS